MSTNPSFFPGWYCDWKNCKKPAVYREGDCALCNRRLCRAHLLNRRHNCPNPQDNFDEFVTQLAAVEARQLDLLCSRIDPAKLCAHASRLREGINCTVDLSKETLSSMMGNWNCHAEITFEDGVKWLARFRLISISTAPQEAHDYVLRSEADTMDFLQNFTSVPSPKIFGWKSESDPLNTVGRVGYILMEKLPGKPLDWKAATVQQKEKVMQQLVDIFIEIEKHHFPAAGSLVISKDRLPYVKYFAHESIYCRKHTKPLGQFFSSWAGTQSIINLYLEMIASGRIGVRNPIDVFLVHRFRLDLLENFGKDLFTGGEKYYLKHMDDKGDHIIVNDDFDIVGIIDWQWSQFTEKGDAFSAPCMMWPEDKFYEGSNDLSEEELRLAKIFCERGRADLSKCVLEGRKLQRLYFALGPNTRTHEDRETLIKLFMGLKQAFEPIEETWEEWRIKALDRWEDDELLQILLRKYPDSI